jgi:hypothetical protein
MKRKTFKPSISGGLKAFAVLAVGAASFSASAQDWQVSGGGSFTNRSYTLPGSAYSETVRSVNTALMKPIDNWYLGISFNYVDSLIDTVANNGNYHPRSPSANAFVMRRFDTGTFVDFTSGYGKVSIDAATQVGAVKTTYQSQNDFRTTGIGVTQYIPLGTSTMASASWRYTHINSNTGGYTTSAGAAVPATYVDWGFSTVGASLMYMGESVQPFVRVNWHNANREFTAGSDDREYGSYSLGLTFPMSKQTSLAVSYSSVFEKAYVKEDTVGLTLSYKF